MKTFIEFLVETPWINPDIEWDNAPDAKEHEAAAKQRQKISTMSSGHVVKIRHASGNPTFVTYTAHGPDNNIHMKVSGHKDGDKFTVNNLNDHQGSTVRAHDFYHHLITHHGLHLHSDYEQSEGGMKVWKKLHKMPGIHMQSYNGSTEKYSELKPSFQRLYDMDSSTRLAAKKI